MESPVLDVTSVSSKSAVVKKSDYHHGNLRNALIEAGRDALREVSAQDLSLRYLARIVGVSEAAPSRHFSGINELLASIAAGGFRELAWSRIKIHESEDTALSKAYRMMHVYVEFAQREKNLFGLMIGPRIVTREAYPELAAESGRSFALFSSAIEALAIESGWRTEDLNLVTHTAWSMEHGLATLIIADRAPRAEIAVPIDHMVDFAIMSVISAIVTGPEHLRTVMKRCGTSAPEQRSNRKSAVGKQGSDE